MAATNKDHKKVLAQKFLEFQKNGLLQNGKYLTQQLKISNKMSFNQAYKTYIEQQIVLNDKKISAVDEKLKKY